MLTLSTRQSFIVIFLIFLGTACGNANDPKKSDWGEACSTADSSVITHPCEVYSKLSVRLDGGLSSTEKNTLISDLYQFLQYKIQAAPGSFFDQVFQGTTQDHVIQYMNDRLHYIIPAGALDHWLTEGLTERETEAIGQVASLSGALQDNQVYTVALNIGTVLWFDSLATSPSHLSFEEGGNAVPIHSSRIGIIQLGEGYTAQEDGKDAFPPLFRISALVHEARHSDCTGGLSAASLDQIRSGLAPTQRTCGHLHLDCPKGHPYEGLPACDDEAWGAYSIQALYANAIETACSNCSSEEKTIAKAVEIDSWSRVLVLDDMLDGRLGQPDMSSAN